MATNRRLSIVAAIVGAAAIIGGVASYYTLSGSPSALEEEASNMDGIASPFPADAVQYGSTYGEWTAKWWEWALEIPEENNPILDEAGKDCDEGQSGPVWFLAGSTGGLVERKCVIPAGKAILAPLMNLECSMVENPTLSTEAELRDCAVSGNEGVTELFAAIDGVAIKESDLRSYRVQSPMFEIDLPEGNLAGGPAGTTQAVSDGYWLFIPPLPPGEHEIHFRGSIVDYSTGAPNNFVSEAKYQITVSE